MDNGLALVGMWLLGVAFVAYIARDRGQSVLTWAAIALLISPVLALVALLATSRRR